MVKRKKVIPAKARHPTEGNENNKKIIIVNSGYSEGGASRTRSTLRGYNPLKSSTKADVDVNLVTLRNRSADLVCNSPLGSSAINTSRSNVIGAGLKVSPKVDYRLQRKLKSGSVRRFVNLTFGQTARPVICIEKITFLICRILHI